MLRGLALNYYYTNLKSNPLSISFNKLYKAIYNYFKGSEYRRNILTQWNATKLLLGIISYVVTWSSHDAAALAWRGALSSLPSLTLS
jgi:hypothetical protein